MIVVDVSRPRSVQAELVLYVDDVGVRAVDRISRGAVVSRVPLPDPPAHLSAVRPDLVRLVDRGHPELDARVGPFHRAHQIGREGCYAAVPRQVRSYKDDPGTDRVPILVHASLESRVFVGFNMQSAE